MREKHPFIVLSFHTTVAAMEWEKRCMETGIPGRLIPLPREISAGCGLAWRMHPEEWEQWSERIVAYNFHEIAPPKAEMPSFV